MLKKVVITNCFGESMEYAIDGVQAENPSGLIITSIDGLGPVKANINMMDLATTDGQRYNSARLSGRNIVIKALFTHATSIEEARLLSYKYFPIKKKLKFHIETDNRVGEVEGYVESNEPDIFSELSSCQISIVCESPYFDGGEIVYNFNDTIPNFKFAFGNESLNERLIKISENATSDTERELIYNGDIDTGVEMNFGFPTDDLSDSFKVTKIEMSEGGNKTMALDLSKMNTLVPDTAPHALSVQRLIYVSNGYKGNYYGQLPAQTSILSNGNYQSTYLSSKNEIHIFNYNKHFVINTNNNVEQLSDLKKPELVTTSWPRVTKSSVLTSLGNDIYLFYFAYGIRVCYKYNPEINDWDGIGQLPFDYAGDIARIKTVEYNNVLHIFETTNGGENIHWEFDGSTFTQIEILSTVLSSFFPKNYFKFNNTSRVIIHDNKIHIFGKNTSESAGLNIHHYTLDANGAWEEPSNGLPSLSYIYSGYILSAVSYKNALHLFFDSVVNSEYQLYNHFVLNNGDNTWQVSDFQLSFRYGGQPIAMNDYIYFVSGDCDLSTSHFYDEEADNTKLIENDQLVVSTIKGKKGVTLIRGENKYNVINILEKNPTWFELKRGSNFFSYLAEGGSEDDLKLTIKANKWYEGV